MLKKSLTEDAKHKIELFTDHNFVTPDYFPVPLRSTVYIKKSSNQDMMTTEGGIIISAEGSNNHLIPNVGVVYAVGPECSEHLKAGQRVMFSQFANLEIMIKGEIYMVISELDIYGVMPSDAYVRMDTLTDKEVGTKSRIEREGTYLKNKKVSDDEQANAKELFKLKK